MKCIINFAPWIFKALISPRKPDYAIKVSFQQVSAFSFSYFEKDLSG